MTVVFDFNAPRSQIKPKKFEHVWRKTNANVNNKDIAYETKQSNQFLNSKSTNFVCVMEYVCIFAIWKNSIEQFKTDVVI